MWEIRSCDIGYHLYKDGQLRADLYGFYRDWVELVKRLNDLDIPKQKETMRSRLDDLSIAEIETYAKCCSNCDRLYIFEEAHVTRQGRFLEIMLLCPECGRREKVALHSWYERGSGSDAAKQSDKESAKCLS